VFRTLKIHTDAAGAGLLQGGHNVPIEMQALFAVCHWTCRCAHVSNVLLIVINRDPQALSQLIEGRSGFGGIGSSPSVVLPKCNSFRCKSFQSLQRLRNHHICYGCAAYGCAVWMCRVVYSAGTGQPAPTWLLRLTEPHPQCWNKTAVL